MRSMGFLGTSVLCVTAVAAMSIFSVLAMGAQTSTSAGRTLTTQATRIVTLAPSTEEETAAAGTADGTKAVQKTPANFRQFDRQGKTRIGDTQTLTLHFAAAAKLLKIKSTADFKVEQGGSCLEGSSYLANSSCTLMVRSTPQGPGPRLGLMAITSSADAHPLFVGLGGYGNAPAISFTPSIISTVPGTSVSGAGIISGATSLAVDGGDSLYIADTGHSKIEYINSSGTIQNLTTSFGATAPISVTVDHNGFTYFTERSQFFLYILPNQTEETYFYASSNTCAIGSTCALYGANINYQNLGAIATDPNGTVFMNTFAGAARLAPSPSIFSENYIPLYTPYNYNNDFSSTPQPLAVDNSDTVYTYYNSGNGTDCQISGESYYSAVGDVFNPVTVAGGPGCGFSGDGGQARSAEIGKQVGQMTFDIAGNLYFTDTLNQRVRRIDNATGVITTIAGNGTVGYSGDGLPATSATLSSPTGVGVDSQGQVYILSSATSGQVVRKVGAVGALNLGGLVVGSPSPVQTIQLANTGNADLDFTHVGFSSGNTADFAIDPNTTNCNFTVPLASGRSCKIGFIFTPTATGTRSAVLSITDDTIAGVNTIQLSGAGYTTATLTPASFSFASTNAGSSSAVQTATLTNTGQAIMTISGVAFSGTGATSYSDTTTCGATLAVGASCTIAVTFKPAAVGSLPATLTVSDNAYTLRQTVALTGTGVGAAKASVSPASLTFASTTVGSTSAVQAIKLSNTGTAALAITSITMTGTNATDFPLTQTCGTSVAAGGSCTISVSFKPTAAGTRAGTVSIVGSTGTLTAAVTGTAVAAAKATLAPTALSFGSQLTSTSSAAKTVTLTNSGGVALTISSYALSGTNSSDFSQTHSCGSSLAAGANCTISVVFKPAATGARTATLTVVTSAGLVSATVGGTSSAAAAVVPKVTLVSGANPMAMNGTLVLTVQVVGGSTAVPTGTVQLMDASNAMFRGGLSKGGVTFTVSGMSAGVHVLQAVYLGDSKTAAASSNLVRQMVMAVPGGPIMTPPHGPQGSY